MQSVTSTQYPYLSKQWIANQLQFPSMTDRLLAWNRHHSNNKKMLSMTKPQTPRHKGVVFNPFNSRSPIIFDSINCPNIFNFADCRLFACIIMVNVNSPLAVAICPHLRVMLCYHLSDTDGCELWNCHYWNGYLGSQWVSYESV